MYKIPLVDLVPSMTMASVSFSQYTEPELLRLSVKAVTNPMTFDVLNHPNSGGLHDPAFGPNESSEVCVTCGLISEHCPGHMGHIPLPLPVYNPLTFHTMYKILRGSCFNCHRLYMHRTAAYLYTKQMQALHAGLLETVQVLQEIVSSHPLDKTTDHLAVFTIVKTKMDDCLTAALSGIVDHKVEGVKNLDACRNALLNSFLKICSSHNTKCCPHCHDLVRKIRQDKSSKLYYTSGKHNSHSLKLKRRYDLKQGTINLFPRLRPTDHPPSKPSPSDSDDDIEENDREADLNNAKTAEQTAEEEGNAEEGQIFLTVVEVRNQLRKLWINEKDVIGQVFGMLQESNNNYTRVQKNSSSDDAAGTGESSSKSSSSSTVAAPTDIFFMINIPVMPTKFRPLSKMAGNTYECPQTTTLAKVVEDATILRGMLSEIKKLSSDKDKITFAQPAEMLVNLAASKKLTRDTTASIVNIERYWLNLQTHCNAIYDSDLDKLSTSSIGVKQILEKKEGLYRKHMMGKRVDYACRSVISPDPNIATNEIGIPIVFARRLTYPQAVTAWNYDEMKKLVINGPNKYPGANYVIMNGGAKKRIDPNSKAERIALAKLLMVPSGKMLHGAKQVCRHLKDGDYMLLNRQPTLHRPSIQGHKVRVLKHEKTLRLHYANCKAYNADFDGDEMNAHFPQTELGRAEAKHIASAHYQYLVPKDGTPLAGLIQDHMIAGVQLTIRGQFYNRDDYIQLISGALLCNGEMSKRKFKLLPPTIIKPCFLWSGKQVLSTIILNTIPIDKDPLSLEGVSKITDRCWVQRDLESNDIWKYGGTPLKDNQMSESCVIIRQGELLTGVLDKAHYGATAYGLVHCCYELYGGEVAGQLLSILANLFTCYLQISGFSLGVEDILCIPKANRKRRSIMRKMAGVGEKVTQIAFQLDEEDSQDKSLVNDMLNDSHWNVEGGMKKDIDLSMKTMTDEYQNKISKSIIPFGLLKTFPKNSLQLMVLSGAKGSSVNCMQISCLLGQIELEGARPPLMLTGRSLPSFLPFDTSPRAGGFIDGRFLTGIRPQEYYVHCMAGREGLIDTAVKTSRSGYLQRCLVKHLEGIVVDYDLTVRDSDSSVIQFQYGEDGLDVLKTQFLQSSAFQFLIKNRRSLVSAADMKSRLAKLNTEDATELWNKVNCWKSQNEDLGRDVFERKSSFLHFSRKLLRRDRKLAVEDRKYAGLTTSKLNLVLRTEWYELGDKKKRKYDLDDANSKCPEPVMSLLRPDTHFGSISEKLENIISCYTSESNLLSSRVTKDNKDGRVSRKVFNKMMKLRALESLVQPAEGVGLLAAQSIGEPSTQMTLNTFHFAGRGEMNVTLGIPRMREILMVGSENIKTPTMEVMLKEVPEARQNAKYLKRTFNRVLLSQVLEDIDITEKIHVKASMDKARLYKIRFNFLPHRMYVEEYIVSPKSILSSLEHRFFKKLQDVITKSLTEMNNAKLMSQTNMKENSQIKTNSNSTEGLDSDDELEYADADGDATTARQMNRMDDEGNEYEGEKEDVEQPDPISDSDSDDEDKGKDSEASGNESDDSAVLITVPEMNEARCNMVVSSLKYAVEYAYDTSEGIWSEITLRLPLAERKIDMTSIVEKEARNFILYQVKGINRCFVTEDQESSTLERPVTTLKFEGVNLKEMYYYQEMLKLNQLYSNNIHAMANTYGIEAAVRVLIKEIRDVFDGYGIKVDYRHLSLIADYMTYEGSYKPFNRVGIQSNTSPFQKMTFETSMGFLKSAIIHGSKDKLTSPSARLITGGLVGTGTGKFGLVVN